jgi:hypothetical protein
MSLNDIALVLVTLGALVGLTAGVIAAIWDS